MIEFMLALLGTLALIAISMLVGMGILVYAMMQAAKKGNDGAILIAYDQYEDKVTILDGSKFEYKIFDK